MGGDWVLGAFKKEQMMNGQKTLTAHEKMQIHPLLELLIAIVIKSDLKPCLNGKVI